LIPKTAVFIDSHTDIAKTERLFQLWLIEITKDLPPDQRYVVGGDNPALNVLNVVSTFTARLSENDRNKRYAEFLKEDSIIRIMIATTSLGTGINVPDVSRVVIWGFPIGKDPAEVWQRSGRGGRDEGRTSIAYCFFPFWAFDDQGEYKASDEDVASEPPGNAPTTRKRTRNKTRARRRLDRARVHTGTQLDDLEDTDESESDAESVCSISSQVEEDPDAEESTAEGSLVTLAGKNPPKTRYWSKQHRGQREKLDKVWKDLCNAICKREVILEHLGEKKVPYQTERAKRVGCCNGCNANLNPKLVFPKTLSLELPTAPTKDSRAAFALLSIDEWAAEKAVEYFGD
jgi:superfamily II DNA helicase RecQ